MKRKIFNWFLGLLVIAFVFGVENFAFAEEILDTTAPTGTIIINDGALYTNSRDVTLTLEATDDSGVVSEMRIANHNTYHDPESYATTKSWTLTVGDGEKVVRVKFKDQAGNETGTGIPATIILDTVTPVVTLTGNATINLNVNDAYTDAGASALDSTTDITSSIVKGGTYTNTATAGTYTITYDVTDNAGNKATQVTRTIIVSSPTQDPVENFVIRNGNTIIYEGTHALPESKTIKIPDSKGVEHDIDSRSVLAILYDIDKSANSFSISNLDYNAGYGSLYMKCLTPSEADNLCDNWQYTVNNVYPDFGMDKKILSGNERVYIYFGPQNRNLLSNNSISDNEELKVTTEKYDYENNLWIPRTNVTVGLTQPDPNGGWDPIDNIKTAVDSTGVATFSSVPVGEYDVGVKEDYYWPTIKLTVTKAQDNGGGGGGNPPIEHHKIDINKALEFLSSKQNSDGSFSSDLYTDWAGIAFASSNNSSAKDKITEYLKTNNLNSGIATDNERHAMALMSLGINPYIGTEINYIKKIIDAFDGTQFGDKDLVNDDIFAIFPLIKAGYDGNDEMIQKDVLFIISKQGGDGSWGSVDLTAAAIQALSLLPSSGEITQSKSQAEQYLKSVQQPNGGFENSSSTSWALQAISALSEDSSTWLNNNLDPNDYLYSLQQADGGIDSLETDDDARIWATSYAVPGALGKTWEDIMQSFEKYIETSSSSSEDDEEIPTKEEVLPTPILVDVSPSPKLEDKKVELKPKNNFVKTNKIKTSEEPKFKTLNIENSLAASVGDAEPVKISLKKLSQDITRIAFSIGESFRNVIFYLKGTIGAIFR